MGKLSAWWQRLQEEVEQCRRRRSAGTGSLLLHWGETQAGEGTAWERDKTLHQLPLGSTWALSADQLLSSRILCLTTSNISSPVAFKSKRDPDPRIP